MRLKRYLFMLTAVTILALPACAPRERHTSLADIMSRQRQFAPERDEAGWQGEVSTTKGTGEPLKLDMPDYLQKKQPKPLPPQEPPKPVDVSKFALQKKPVMINVENMPLNDFITYGMGETLKVNFFVDDAVRKMKNPVTLRMAQEVPAAQALEAAIEVLRRQGVDVQERGGTLYIVKAQPPPAPAAPLDVNVGFSAPAGGSQVLQVVTLKHIFAQTAMVMINDYYRLGVQMKEPARNVLLISGSAAAIREILSFIEIIDVPYFQGKQVFTVKLTYWQPDDFVKQMSTILTGLGFTIASTAKDPGTLFIPVKFLASVIIAAPDEKTFRVIMGWKDKLDTAEGAGTEEKLFVFHPRFSRGSDLVDAVRKLYGVTTPVPAATGAPGAGASPISSAALPGMRIAADDRRNLVTVITTPATYKRMLTFFEELDKVPRQVLIETTIAEITLKDDLKFGLEWFINNRMKDGTYALGTLFGTGVTSPGLVYSYLADSGAFRSLLNAFAQMNLINILSTPRIMVLDNQEATIQVGTEVPIVTSEQATQATTVQQPTVLRNIQYRTTGVVLRVKPTINTEGALTLTISQEVSESQKNAYSNIDSPMILVRRMNTQIVGEHGRTIMLGGLISDTESEGENKVPFLGDIPLFGYLFKTTSRSKTKTELIVMLTPVILSNVEDAVNITNDVKQSLKWLQ
jgi:general secretion pathway protein D